MRRQAGDRAWRFIRNQITGQFSDSEARVLCYVLGPISGALFLRFRPQSWSVRFHAAYSILMSFSWALAWGALRGLEALSPWFLGVLFRELRFGLNLAFLVIWAILLISAYQGSRCAVIPSLHELAVRLARRYTREPAVP